MTLYKYKVGIVAHCLIRSVAMKITRRIAARMAALAVLALPVCAMAQAPAGALAGQEVDELTKCIQDIGSAMTLDAAASAYAKGCSLNRRSSKLQLAYLRKMLQVGRPDIAQFAAGELSAVDPKAGLAWGTLAYMQAKKEQYLPALTPAVRAADLEPKNEPICRNAAQLVAWSEAGERGNVDAAIVETMKGLPSASKEFAAAYKRAKEAFKKLADKQADKDKQAKEAEAEAKKAESEYKKYSDQLKSAGQAYDKEWQRLRDAQQDLNRLNYNNSNNNNNRTGRNNNSRTYDQGQRNNIERRINDINKNLRQKESDGKKIRADVDKAKKEALAKHDQAGKLTRDAKKLSDGMPDNFGWLPPAVDGVTTPDATVPKPVSAGTKSDEPASSYLVPDQPATHPGTAQQKAPIEQRLAEAQAAEKLDMAKLCMGSDTAAMKARARELLNEILAKFASTPSAAEAKELLAKLQ